MQEIGEVGCLGDCKSSMKGRVDPEYLEGGVGEGCIRKHPHSN